MIRKLEPSDASRVLEIYKMGIDSEHSTFETTLPTWEEWDSRHHTHSRYVYIVDNLVVGWIALSPTSLRYAYRGVAEVSIYIHPKFHGQGIGSKLMEEMIISSEKNGIWTLVSSVFPENVATLRLHEKYGFRKVGYREKVANLNGFWKDTIILERRSQIVYPPDSC